MKKTINFLKSWSVRIFTLPTVAKPLHTAWQSFAAVLLVGVFAVHSVSDLQALVIAAAAAALSSLKTALVQVYKSGQVNIPGEEN